MSISLIFSSCAKKREKWIVYSNISEAYSIACTPDYLWIATHGGLVRWDRKNRTYQNFTTLDGLGSDWVDYVYPDSSGNLWIGGYQALTKYDGKNFEVFLARDILADKWEEYRRKQFQGEGILNQLHFFIAGQDADNRLWFTAAGGLSTFTGKKWIHRNISSSLSYLSQRRKFIDSKNRIWTTRSGHGVYMIDSKEVTLYTQDDGLADKYPDYILEDRKGNIWVSSRSNGVSRFNGKKWASFSTSDGLSNERVLVIYEDSRKNIWLGTFKGCCRYDGKEWSTYEELSDFWVGYFAEDDDGKLWAATGKGICWLNGEKWELLDYHPDDPITHNWVITSAIDNEGNLWFGTGAGVSVFDGTGWQKYPLLNDRVDDILVLDSGEIWVAMRGGIGRFLEGKWKIYTTEDGLAGNHATSVARDLEGNLWFGTTQRGLSRFDGKEWKTYMTDDGLVSNHIYSITVDSEGKIWCGTFSGISAFDGTYWKNYSTEDGLPKEIIHNITFDSEGNLWFASLGGGIGSYDGSQWKRITMEDGLPDNKVYSITADDEGRIWVATENEGACVFKGNTWRNFTPSDGLATRYVRKILIDKTGAVWFATAAGISKLEGFKFPD